MNANIDFHGSPVPKCSTSLCNINAVFLPIIKEKLNYNKCYTITQLVGL
jgi:hypothetical protein